MVELERALPFRVQFGKITVFIGKAAKEKKEKRNREDEGDTIPSSVKR